MAWRSDRCRRLGVAALGMLLGCFESSVAPTPSETSSSGATPGDACIPGETQTCLCVGGGQGVQVCNAEGSGYGECACVGGTTAASTSGDTDSGTSISTTNVDTSSGGIAESGMLETSDVDTGPPDVPGYGPCALGICPEDQVCIGDGAIRGSVCAEPCETDQDCSLPPPEYQGQPTCQDVAASGMLVCVLSCATNGECPTGMDCALSVCTWPLF